MSEKKICTVVDVKRQMHFLSLLNYDMDFKYIHIYLMILELENVAVLKIILKYNIFLQNVVVWKYHLTLYLSELSVVTFSHLLFNLKASHHQALSP